MREEQAFSRIQRFDTLHLLFRQGEIKYIEILFHPALMHGFRYHDHPVLDQEPERRLCHGFSMLIPDLFQHRILEIIVLA